MKAKVRRALLTFVFAGLLLIGGLALFQDSLIYFPENPARQNVLADAGMQRGGRGGTTFATAPPRRERWVPRHT